MTQQQPDEVRVRVRGYLTSQAEAKGFPELKPAVEEARAALVSEVEGLSDAEASFKPEGEGEDGWSVMEILRHVAFEEEDLTRQIEALAAGRSAEGTQLGRLSGREGASLAGLLQDLGDVRRTLLERIDSIAGNERLDTTAPHPWFGELNCRAWFLFQRVHDGDHTRQIQALRASPAFTGGS